jgi:hypothetical protein
MRGSTLQEEEEKEERRMRIFLFRICLRIPLLLGLFVHVVSWGGGVHPFFETVIPLCVDESQLKMSQS